MTKLTDYADPDATIKRPAVTRKQFMKPDMTRLNTVLVPKIIRESLLPASRPKRGFLGTHCLGIFITLFLGLILALVLLSLTQ